MESLDKFIVGQTDAKRAVAIALRNRWRRQQLKDEMKSEVNMLISVQCIELCIISYIAAGNS